MARVLLPGEALEEVGRMGLRSPDGDITETVPLFRIISAEDINPKSNMTSNEEKPCEDIARVLANKFKEYITAQRSE